MLQYNVTTRNTRTIERAALKQIGKLETEDSESPWDRMLL